MYDLYRENADSLFFYVKHTLVTSKAAGVFYTQKS